MFNLLNKGKDVALSIAIKNIVSSKIDKFGEVSKLELDSQLKTMLVEVELKGDTSPLEVVVEKYSIEERDEAYFLKIHEVKTSREWLNIVIKEYIDSQEFELPSKYIKLIKAVI